MGWETVRGHGLWGWAVASGHRSPADHTSSRQISFLGGLALNEGVNWLIKHVIQEPRPCGGEAQAAGIGGPQVGALLGGLQPPTMPCSLPPRPPHGSGHQIRDALQPFPVHVVFRRLFLPFPVFKVSPGQPWPGTHCESFGRHVGLGLLRGWEEPRPGHRAPGSLWMGQELGGGLGWGLRPSDGPVFPECTKRTTPGSWTCCGGTWSPWVSSPQPFWSPTAGTEGGRVGGRRRGRGSPPAPATAPAGVLVPAGPHWSPESQSP